MGSGGQVRLPRSLCSHESSMVFFCMSIVLKSFACKKVDSFLQPGEMCVDGGQRWFRLQKWFRTGFPEAQTLIDGIKVTGGETYPEVSALTDRN